MPPARRNLSVGLLLALLTAAVFWPVHDHGFIAFDDDAHVTNNPVVRQGLTWQGARWAFAEDLTHRSGGPEYWQPLTTLSHMLDVDLFGLDPAGHHLMNVLYHAMNAVLVLWILRGMTGALWPAAFAAALFAVHPLRVESVAWVAERKDVLSALFGLLTVGAYVSYARQGERWRYALACLAYTLSLMAKPAGITLPAALLVVDFWPLGQLNRQTWRRRLTEKIPLFFLALASCAITLHAQPQTVRAHGPGVMAANALVSGAGSVLTWAWPATLSILYPHPGNHLPVWKVLLSAAFLIAVSGTAFRYRRTMPCLLAGWLWYGLLLLPALGIGEWALADRLTYLPHIGLDIALAWGAAALLARFPVPKNWTIAAAMAVLLALSIRTRAQLAYWKDSETLLNHAIEATRNNPVAYSSLADDLARRGFAQEAMARYETALGQNPGFTKAHNNLGNVLLGQGRDAEAIAHFETALRIRPDFPEAHHNLGRAYLHQGLVQEAVVQFQEAVRLKPDRAEFQEGLGVALTRMGRFGEAELPLREAIRLSPQDPKVHNNLGMTLASEGKLAEAVGCFEEALRLQPGYPEAQRNLERARKDPRLRQSTQRPPIPHSP